MDYLAGGCMIRYALIASLTAVTIAQVANAISIKVNCFSVLARDKANAAAVVPRWKNNMYHGWFQPVPGGWTPTFMPGSNFCSCTVPVDIVLALVLYLLTPENHLTIRQALPGGIFFSSGWIIVTKLFQLYVEKYNRYNPTYLALASIIMLLFWMYLTCLFLLLGGKLNAILRDEWERQRTPAPPVVVEAAPVA